MTTRYINISSEKIQSGIFDECKEEHFKRKIELYCLSFKSIIRQGKLNQGHGKAQLLLDRYKKASMVV